MKQDCIEIKSISTSSTKGVISEIPLEKICWLRQNKIKGYFLVTFSILTLGLLYLVCLLSANLKRWLTTSKCDPEEATSFTYVDENANLIVGRVNHVNVGSTTSSDIVTIEIACQRYYVAIDNRCKVLKKVDSVPKNFKANFVLVRGTDDEEIRSTLVAQYGPNSMTLPETNFVEILTRQIFHPFYVFQYFAVAVWLSADYIFYSLVILLITFGAVYLTTSEIVFNLQRLRDLAGKEETIQRQIGTTSTSPVTSQKLSHDTKNPLLQNRSTNSSSTSLSSIKTVLQTVPSSSLVPGDYVIITDEMVLPCDILLVSGRAVVDESMLTGESVPVTKQSYDTSEKDQIDAARNANNILFSGTRALSASGGLTNDSSLKCAVGVVYRTGFRSAKGQLVASLLSPKKDYLAFFSDALVVILFMFGLTVLLYLWTLQYLLRLHLDVGTMILKFLDAITIAVPPALTASLTVATAVCVDRLRSKDIFVSDTARLNWAGVVNAVCFDKTGTLTEERLDFAGVSVYSAKTKKSIEYSHGDMSQIPPAVFELMGTCHGLSLMNGNFVGDPLEKELVRASGWKLGIGDRGLMHAAPPLNPNTTRTTSTFSSSSQHSVVGGRGNISASTHSVSSVSSLSDPTRKHIIARHFDFTPEKLRSASLVRRPTGEYIYVVKGSPEKILKLSRPESIPDDISVLLTNLGRRGLRVIGMATKICTKLNMNELLTSPQELIEADGLDYLGLAFLSSRLKHDTQSTMELLHRANIYTNMITGDHVYTAVAVGRECGLMLDSKTLFIIDVNPITHELEVCSSDGRLALIGDILINSKRHLDLEAIHELKIEHIIQHFTEHNENYKEIQIAITGQALDYLQDHSNSMLPLLIRQCHVFARMKPKDKKLIVEQLMRSSGTWKQRKISNLLSGSSRGYDESESQHTIDASEGAKSTFGSEPGLHLLDHSVSNNKTVSKFMAYKVMFCGDGANDMAALKASTVGVSLCDAETSVAAPVTSKAQTPGAVIDVLREGRASLITAYVLVNFNIMYGVIQLFMTCQLYSYGLKVGNYMYLIQDLLYTLVLGIAITLTPAMPILSVELPPHRFFTRHLIVKLFSQLICFPAFQLIALIILNQQPWYVKYQVTAEKGPLSETYSIEASVLSSLALAQLMIASVAATIDEPFRTPWYKNGYHLFALGIQFLFLTYQLLSRESRINYYFLEVEPLPFQFCGIMVGLILCNCVVSAILARISDCLK